MTLGRPQQFDTVEVTHQALACFRVSAYGAPSTRDLSTACRVSSSTLYGVLGGKSRLFISAVDLYTEQLLASMMALRCALPAANQDAQHFFAVLFADIAQGAGTDNGRYGCLLFNSLIEFGCSESAEAHHVRQALQRVRDCFIEILQGSVAPLQPEETVVLADAALVSIAGLRTLLRAGLSKQRAEAVAAQMVYSLFHPQEH